MIESLLINDLDETKLKKIRIYIALIFCRGETKAYTILVTMKYVVFGIY